jgi:hypothetical protein
MAKYEPNRNDKQRAWVKSMAALGMDHALIAKRIGLTLAQLEAKYSRELQTASPEIDAFVGGSLFQKALSGDVTAQIFWLKTRAGWSETIKRELSGPQRAPIALTLAKQRVRIVLPCNKHNACPRRTPERYVRVLEEILRELKIKRALLGRGSTSE